MKVLLVDTSFSARPIYDHLVSSGHEVYVMGRNSEDALAGGERYAQLDYSDVGELAQWIDVNGIEAIVPGGNDLSYRVCSQVNEGRGLCSMDPLEIDRLINDKASFRAFATKEGLHVPMALAPDVAASFLPVIVKPTDAFSGHGITVVRSGGEAALDAAIVEAKKASPTGSVVVEQFVEGQLYSHSAFLAGGRVDVDFIVEEHGTVDPHAVDTSRVVEDFNPDLLAGVRSDIEKMSAALGLSDGLIHTQFICRGDDFWLIEITRRCPGDLYSMLIEYSTGYPYAARYAESFLGGVNSLPERGRPGRRIIRHTLTPDRELIYDSISFRRPVPILEQVHLKKPGERLPKGPPGRAGVIFFEPDGDSEEAVFEALLKRELYDWKCT